EAAAKWGGSIGPSVFAGVRTRGGKGVFAPPQKPLGRVAEPRHVDMMNALMREALLIGPAQKAQLPSWQAAGKTGTSQDFRDAWFIGYTGHLVAGVWLGNDDSSPTKKATGGSLPVEIWSRFMKVAHQGVAVAALPGLSAAPSFASALPSIAPPPAPVAGPVSRQARGPSLRPQPIEPALDGWFLDRLFGRR